MSREIKYRVYDKKEKCYSDKAFSIDQLGICYIQDEDGYWEEIDEERYIIEQYTCLTDKNGKVIYEGDIVKVYSRRKLLDGLYQVIWNEEAGGFECECLKPMVEDYDNIKDVRVFNEYYAHFCVIGNIHENPELLEDK